jgi:large-conductance mechanosensitive channel
MDNRNFVDPDKLKTGIQNEFSEYREFAFGKNLFAMALALILANAAQGVVNKISDCVLMPIINYSISATGGNWRNLVFSPVDGMNLEIGKLCGAFLEFVITTLILYVLYRNVVRQTQKN